MTLKQSYIIFDNPRFIHRKKNWFVIKRTLEINLDKNLSPSCLSRASQVAGLIIILIINLVHSISLIIHSSFTGQLIFDKIY